MSLVESTENHIPHHPKPHAVCVPFPAQGHINPMLQVSKLLHQRGFHITFVNTEFSHGRLLKSLSHNSLQGLPSFRFETIPDGLPPSDAGADATQVALSLCDSTAKNCLVPFRHLVQKLNGAVFPPVTCIVSDVIMSFTLDVSEELGIPNVFFWTASACSFMGCLHCRPLLEKGIIPLKDESYLSNGYLDMDLDWIPGLRGIRLRNMPSIIRTTDPEDVILHFAIRQVERAKRGSAIIVNTFDELECEVLEALSSILPPIYTIGPLGRLVADQVQDNALNLIQSNLWKEETECLEWLSSKEPNSVVYVNFGSVAVMTAQQLTEFAWGIANSGQTFMWVVRPDIVAGDSEVTLPKEFLAETKERGLLVMWCPQEKVLSHPSIGGFLTHNGWNSTLESISHGVPMICWPVGGDQQTNCWFCCDKRGIGMEIDKNAKRGEIELLVRELLEGEKGQVMKKKAMEWEKLAQDATISLTGSSCLNLDEMINRVLLSSFPSTIRKKSHLSKVL
ncbi:UDP-glucuronosyl/UDP-glucosyltransferase [Trema orientale]|uniref:UDP-glucuronosyl/UDP-glucosyltransferase n=1 Tax=Trema orientale TaxID=63057 RepID=A0A2P5F8D5_TREOI|nr:UDP-glucuronosyl/UDP-glucosyltransferase [Trema orientale]